MYSEQKLNKRKLNSSKFIILFFSVAFIISSCAKEKDSNSVQGTKLSFQIASIIEPAAFKSSLSEGHLSQGITRLESKSFKNENEFHFDVESYDMDLNPQPANSEKQLPSRLANITMNPDVQYRLIVKYASSGRELYNASIRADQQILIDAVKGESYNWYAYSYNDTQAVPAPNAQNSIPSKVDKPLIYTNGKIEAKLGENKMEILFRHQTARVTFAVNTNPYQANIKSLAAELANAESIHQGEFNVITGKMTSTKATGNKSINFKDTGSPDYKEGVMFSATAENLKKVEWKLTELTVSRGDKSRQIVSGPNDKSNISEEWNNAAIGRALLSKVNIWKATRQLKIMHGTKEVMIETKVTLGGHAADAGAAFNFLSNPNAFGNLKESVVKVNGFTHYKDYASRNGKGTENIFNKLVDEKPDILIIAEEYDLGGNDVNEVVAYLNRGGIVILFTDFRNAGFGTLDPSWDNTHGALLKRLYPNSSMFQASDAGVTNQAAIFTMVNESSETSDIINGPFGSVARVSWGSDLGRTVAITGAGNDIITYSSSTRVTRTSGSSNGSTMFKGKNHKIFWVGDGGFLANPAPNGEPNHGGTGDKGTHSGLYTKEGHLPFATSSQNMPATYYYGKPNKQTYNSQIFGNIMAWAVAQADLTDWK